MWRRDDDSEKVFDRLPSLGPSLARSVAVVGDVGRSGEMECICHPRESERLRDVRGHPLSTYAPRGRGGGGPKAYVVREVA